MEKNLNKIFNNLLYYLLFLMPIIDFITSIYTWSGKHFWVSSLLKTLMLGIFFLIVLKKNKDRKICLILLLYFIIDGIYIFLSNSNVVMYIASLLKIFFIPIALLFLKDYDNQKINTTFLVKIFYLYLLLLIIPYFLGIGHNISEIYVNKEAYLSFFYSGNELSGVLLCLMPIVLNYLKEHHNYFI